MKLHSSSSVAIKSGLAKNTLPGFALVVTLSLMILLTIIAVGLLSLSSVALRSSSQSEAVAIARANARLALMLAIGELQKEAGPDQRISSRAEILDSKADTPDVDGVKQPHWTGIWKTGDKPTETQRAESIGSDKIKQAAWLVSNPNPATKLDPTTYSGNITGVKPDAVQLASKLGVSPNQTNVAVPLVGVITNSATKQPSGQFGYWVSDEGVKAKVSIKDPTINLGASGGTYVQNLSHFATSQANAAHKILPSPLNQDLRDSGSASKILSLGTLKLTSKTPATTDLRNYAPDLTSESWGVLADARKGGLKNDLTAAFEDDETSNAGQYEALKASGGSGMDALCVYRSSSEWQYGAKPATPATPFSGSATMDGLRWRSLYLYYNLYKNTMSLNRNKAGAQQPPTGIQSSNLGFSSGALTIPQRAPVQNDDGVAAVGYLLDPLVPVTLQARVDVALESFVDPGTKKYRLRLRYYPMMVLWNPYSVRISANPSPSQSFYTNLFRRWSITMKVGSTVITPFDGGANCNLFQGGGYLPTLNTKAADTASFEPGEIKIFALADNDVAKTNLGDPAKSNVCVFNELANSGKLADWNQYYDLPWAGTDKPSDLIDVSVGNSNLDANATYNNGGPLNSWPDGTQPYNLRISTYSPPSVKPTSTWPNPKPAIQTMNGTPFLIVGFNYRAKGIKQTTDSNYFNSAFNPPMFMGNSTSFTNVNTVGYWRELYARNFKPYTSVSEVQNVKGRTSWGLNSVGVDPVSTESSQLVLLDVPVQPMFSIGQFVHLSPFYYESSGGYHAEYFATNFIGGSLASPNVSMDTNTNSTGSTIYMDHSYLANLALFDSCFFSTVPASKQRSEDSDKYIMKSTELDSAISMDRPLPNNRMRFYRKGNTAPKAADLRDVKKAAANLMLDGAFNINSTSVNAWRALLSSLSGNDLKLWNPSAGSANVIDKTTLNNPIPRFWSITNKGKVNEPFEGMRALSDTEVTGLAEQIVRQVKTRGPFLSLADFLNRRLAPSATDKAQLYTMGALQAAIESTSPDINAAAKAAGTASSLNTTLKGDPFGANVYGNPSSAKSGPGAGGWTTELTSANTSIPANTATGIPGYLMQQDLVQAFAPVMTPRSDTFVVRGYGEAKDANGRVTAKAWCEAVVQRIPEYIDPSDPALTRKNTYGNNLGDATPPYERRTSSSDPASIINKTNETFGRKFAIPSFRWLSENEI